MSDTIQQLQRTPKNARPAVSPVSALSKLTDGLMPSMVSVSGATIAAAVEAAFPKAGACQSIVAMGNQSSICHTGIPRGKKVIDGVDILQHISDLCINGRVNARA